MTRANFYAITILLTVVASVCIYTANNASEMEHSRWWLITSIASYLVWHDWDYFPKCMYDIAVRAINKVKSIK